MQAAALSHSDRKTGNALGTFAKNSAANAGGMIITSLVAFLLPAYLVHHLSTQMYGAWVLILNLSAYVGYLDFGVQTAVSKYIAEYQATGDHVGSVQCVSAGLLIMSIASTVGILLTCGLAYWVPMLFRNMPPTLYHDVRVSILLVGISSSISLSASIFPAIFLGLQRYKVTATVSVISRLLYATVLCVAVYLHSTLATMGKSVAMVYLIMSLLQVVAWKKFAGHIAVRLYPIDLAKLRQMLKYCFVLTVWSVCMLFILGLDLTIVGHYDFGQVAYYSIATAPTNFMLVIIGALLGPLLPASSALSTSRTSQQMGRILLRTTRYTTIILLLSGLPLLVGGFLVLRIWVGSNYAFNSVQLLRILLLANITRQLCAPYATMVVATAKQSVATFAAITEGVVNLAASLWLARRFGAMGVAMGTLIGACASVAMHFGVSMQYTHNLAISRTELLLQGLLRPATMAIPSVLLVPFWWFSGKPSMSVQLWSAWGLATLLLMWYASMVDGDRTALIQTVKSSLNVT